MKRSHGRQTSKRRTRRSQTPRAIADEITSLPLAEHANNRVSEWVGNLWCLQLFDLAVQLHALRDIELQQAAITVLVQRLEPLLETFQRALTLLVEERESEEQES